VYKSRPLRNFPIPRATCLNLEKQELGVVGVPGVALTPDWVPALSKLEPCNLRYLYFKSWRPFTFGQTSVRTAHPPLTACVEGEQRLSRAMARATFPDLGVGCCSSAYPCLTSLQSLGNPFRIVWLFESLLDHSIQLIHVRIQGVWALNCYCITHIGRTCRANPY
jgi:hypothetical protein